MDMVPEDSPVPQARNYQQEVAVEMGCILWVIEGTWSNTIFNSWTICKIGNSFIPQYGRQWFVWLVVHGLEGTERDKFWVTP